MSFLRPLENELAIAFSQQGYIIQPAEDREALDRIQRHIADLAAAFVGKPAPPDASSFLDNISHCLELSQLNDLRLHVISGLMATSWFREAYFSCARSLLETLVGNELAMQRNLGLSVQLPGDRSSLLPLHSDVWGSECSPFEVVMWMPLVDCYRTKSMFVLPVGADGKWRDRMHEFAEKGTESLFRAIEPEVEWLEVPYGNIVVFTPTIMHGNRVNEEETTRWTLNIRFKGLFTPYSDKRLGEYFAPITLRPVSRIAMKFQLPGGFHE
ncbi:MAG: sporadic carbohydrate cluster 2OG-Fe(II) oxygenase [Cyanobacteriota bacterium]|nr:sporadic carbohydrate cluster 2OG-Fe(II) oxygenase [Cyanobacteriota bacterium]